MNGKNKPASAGAAFAVLALIFLVSVIVYVSVGSSFISPVKIYEILIAGAGGTDASVLLNIRLPRAILVFITGAALSVSGAVFQALFKNPLAEPYILGVSGGAALGSALAIVFFGSYSTIMILSIAGSFCAIMLVYLLSMRSRFGSPGLILAGMSLSFIMSSSVLLIYSFAKSDQVHKALFWMLGDFSMARSGMLGVSSALIAALIALIFMMRGHLNIISFGENFSSNLGVTRASTAVLFFAASSLAAITVSMTGVIGFAGLIVPHIMRKMFGPHHSFLIPACILGGGIFLLISDALGRSIVPPYEVPAGVITGFIGGIFFLFLMMSGKGEK